MQLFYAPDITVPYYTLSEEESKHCVRVLRLGAGDELMLTDGTGNMFTARIADAHPKRCVVEIVATVSGYGHRSYSLAMAVAPTKNSDRFEWFIEKATEVGVDRFIPLESEHSERRTIKRERVERVVTSAVKQSLKAYYPAIDEMTSFRDVVAMPFDGVKLIAHCEKDRSQRMSISKSFKAGDNVLILIGPEGDFSKEEIIFAVENGFKEITLGDERLRTETAALYAVIAVSILNQ